jgi:hypothetical protein
MAINDNGAERSLVSHNSEDEAEASTTIALFGGARPIKVTSKAFGAQPDLDSQIFPTQ